MEQLDGVADDLIVVPLEVSHLVRYVYPEMLGHLDVVPVHYDDRGSRRRSHRWICRGESGDIHRDGHSGPRSRPSPGRSLIARGEADMEASVRKTLGEIDATATAPSGEPMPRSTIAGRLPTALATHRR